LPNGHFIFCLGPLLARCCVSLGCLQPLFLCQRYMYFMLFVFAVTGQRHSYCCCYASCTTICRGISCFYQFLTLNWVAVWTGWRGQCLVNSWWPLHTIVLDHLMTNWPLVSYRPTPTATLWCFIRSADNCFLTVSFHLIIAPLLCIIKRVLCIVRMRSWFLTYHNLHFSISLRLRGGRMAKHCICMIYSKTS